MVKNHLLALSIVFFLLIGALPGCSLLKRMAGKDPGFLSHEDNMKPMPERAPFDEVWIRDPEMLDKMKDSHKTVVVLPVVTAFVRDAIKKTGLPDSVKAERVEDAEELARYFEQRMKVSFATDDVLKVSDEPVPNSFVWEIAITELEPTNTAVTVVATAAGAFIPGAGLLQRAASGSITIQGIVRDGNTGDILAEFKDRQSDKVAPFTIKDFQMYAHARQAIDDWSEQFFQLASTTRDVKVEGALPVSINPL